jgi:hypothetical protein
MELPNLGVEFKSRLAGAYVPAAEPGAEQPLELEITGQLPNLMQAIFAPRATLAGNIVLAGIADEGRPLAGELELAPLRFVRLIVTFADNQGDECRLEARKDFALSDALQGKAALEGTLSRAAETLGRVRIDVDLLASFGQFLGSLRPAR